MPRSVVDRITIIQNCLRPAFQNTSKDYFGSFAVVVCLHASESPVCFSKPVLLRLHLVFGTWAKFYLIPCVCASVCPGLGFHILCEQEYVLVGNKPKMPTNSRKLWAGWNISTFVVCFFRINMYICMCVHLCAHVLFWMSIYLSMYITTSVCRFWSYVMKNVANEDSDLLYWLFFFSVVLCCVLVGWGVLCWWVAWCVVLWLWLCCFVYYFGHYAAS